MAVTRVVTPGEYEQMLHKVEAVLEESESALSDGYEHYGHDQTLHQVADEILQAIGITYGEEGTDDES